MSISYKQYGTEVIKSEIKFKVLINTSKLDFFTYYTFSEVIERVNILRRTFTHSTFNILIVH